MSKAQRNRQRSARERIAAQRAAQRRAENRRRLLLAGGSVAVVIAVVIAFIVIRGSGSSSSGGGSTTSATGKTLPASVMRDVTSVPDATLATVGAGSVPSFVSTPVKAINGKPLTKNGKPEMLYIGAEFCPYCAAMRWSMAQALSRFGRLSPLGGIHSSPTDTDPNTATLTFYKSSYTSKYLTFTPVENEKVDHSPLQATTKQQQALWDKYDKNSYPFIDVGNKYMITIIYSPKVLAGKTWSQIASAMRRQPHSAIAQGADGAANYVTAAICKVTNNKPASVCTSKAVTAVSGKF